MNVGYIKRVLGGASVKKLNEVIDKVHDKSGKSKFILFFDILGCGVKYGAGYNDYIIFEFYNLKAAQRKTYLTRVKNKKLVTTLNDEKYSIILDEKNRFDKLFKDFLGREVLDLSEIDYDRFAKFAEGKESFFAKPYVGESGKGIEKIKTADFKSTKELYDYVMRKDKNFGLVEEVIVQHPDVAKIYPCALNCLRVVTMLHDGKADIIYSVFKMGNDGNFVDNLENGGLACHFDLDKGEVIGQGHTSALINYDAHPYTGIKFVGYKLPYCEEVKKMVKKAALLLPQAKYIGWDVCITPTGPAIVEGNDYPAYDFPQLPDPDKPKIGLIPTIQKYIPDFK